MEEEYITDANNITVDTFIHASNAQGENANAAFTSEKIASRRSQELDNQKRPIL